MKWQRKHDTCMSLVLLFEETLRADCALVSFPLEARNIGVVSPAFIYHAIVRVIFLLLISIIVLKWHVVLLTF